MYAHTCHACVRAHRHRHTTHAHTHIIITIHKLRERDEHKVWMHKGENEVLPITVELIMHRAPSLDCSRYSVTLSIR